MRFARRPGLSSKVMDTPNRLILAQRAAAERRATVTRRSVLAQGLAAAIALPQMGKLLVAGERRLLRVSTFGGYFERMFAEHVHPAFTRATGIEVQSVEQSEGAQFLLQLAAANKSGKPPMDVCCAGAIDVLRGRAQGLWRDLNAARIPNLSQLPAKFVGHGGADIDSVGAMSWYMTLVVASEVKTLP